MASSVFSVVRKGAPVELFVLNHAFYLDKFKDKVDLASEQYRSPENKPFLFPVVHKVAVRMLGNMNPYTIEYLPVLGDLKMREASQKLLLGADSKAIKENRAITVQTVAGTGAMRLGANFLRTAMCRKKFMISDPQGSNYCRLFMDAGFETLSTYCYWNSKLRKINFEAIKEALCEANSGTVVVLQGCCHNPTGMDLGQKQWKEIAEIMKKKFHFPFFDLTGQGLATGDPEKDAWPVRHFVDEGFELMAVQSFAQNMGLYSEQVGVLNIIQSNSKNTDILKSRLSQLILAMYSSPPGYGARVVGTILNNKCLYNEWLNTIKGIAVRLKGIRNQLSLRLDDMETPGNWGHFNKQKGFFSFTGIEPQHIDQLMKDYHIYMMKNGRINVSCINERNFDYVAEAIHNVVSGIKPVKQSGSCGSTSTTKPDNKPGNTPPAPAGPAPVKPAPVKAAPGNPAPAKAAPGNPAPAKAAPGQPAASKAAPAKPAPAGPAPAKAAPATAAPPKVAPPKAAPPKAAPPKAAPAKAAPAKAAPAKAAPAEAANSATAPRPTPKPTAPATPTSSKPKK